MTSAAKVARVTRVTSAMRATLTKAEVTNTTARERGRMLLIRKNVFRELEPITSLGEFLFKESLLITLTTIQHVLVLHNVYTLHVFFLLCCRSSQFCSKAECDATCRCPTLTNADASDEFCRFGHALDVYGCRTRTCNPDPCLVSQVELNVYASLINSLIWMEPVCWSAVTSRDGWRQNYVTSASFAWMNCTAITSRIRVWSWDIFRARSCE